MKPKVYIDGKEGTTGLQIYERLGERDDIDLLLISEDKRKDPDERRKFLNAADIVFLCLPDAAAKEAVSLIENGKTRVIDASTAHRTADGWDYGFAELSKAHRTAIAASGRVANPGCHASGFIASVYPLVANDVAPVDFAFTCSSLTGYSGGGKKLIAEYEDENRDPRHDSHRIYGLNLNHKHLPEMRHVCGLTHDPVFVPILGDFYKGMATTVMLPGFDAERVHETLAKHYEGQNLVTVAPLGGDEPVIYADTLAGHDSLRLIVSGHAEQAIVTALFDNLGKGASGAAVQNMNIMLGLDETTGLHK
ncbi:N-acetyl-gamma-glutamyl-phosphate reductase [Agathobaculum sp.]|uniref:N-acetyl-gamma-glutamyl-phosphate reductase n=1 Tax=Agathobaculum sp. TaxID=2048138 RepID=UPI002A83CBC8|nr:N-acetyl-gamma-glutamyl-phosphate reductase [Agathobaculum sp.]MDY3617794.1 N-acetyl-gamma-glutamyl-phosphate reductase [Agathobaculum sp.]